MAEWERSLRRSLAMTQPLNGRTCVVEAPRRRSSRGRRRFGVSRQHPKSTVGAPSATRSSRLEGQRTVGVVPANAQYSRAHEAPRITYAHHPIMSPLALRELDLRRSCRSTAQLIARHKHQSRCIRPLPETRTRAPYLPSTAGCGSPVARIKPRGIATCSPSSGRPQRSSWTTVWSLKSSSEHAGQHVGLSAWMRSDGGRSKTAIPVGYQARRLAESPG